MDNKDERFVADDGITVEISSDDGIVTEKSSDGKLQFHFDSAVKRGLVFEEGDVEDTPPMPLKAEPAPKAEQEKPAELPSETEQIKEEFAIPESFDIKAEEERAASDITTTIVSTYLPRFTEVSETYRMNDDPRPRPEKNEKTQVTSGDDSAGQIDGLDPTEEIGQEISVPDAVVVNLNKKAEEEEQTFSIYKFPEREENEPKEPRERTVEDEREEIEELVRREPQTDAEDEKSESEEELPRVIDPEVKREKRPYKLPDPEVSRNVHVVDYTPSAFDERVRVAEAPEGADDSTANGKKSKITEYTAHMQRDTFKDKFLDSIMSSKIRLIAAFVLAFAMLLFENVGLFDVNLARLLRIEGIPGAMAIADFQFAACIFVLALPEVCKAFKHILKGIVIPEITLVFSLLVMAIYTLIITLEAPLIEYPLFGALFAANGISAIAATCCKRNADFIAFKRSSGNGEKRVLDKKLTRTLERENLALDGAVDEYKSKTARIFKTTFVSDFFKRSSRTVENSFNTVLTLALAALASLIAGVAAFFIGNGWLDASATFCAVALFTVPAFSLLVHKLPFYHSSLECDREESAAIGESSIYDYSGVDVIAFEDTDIFGVEDVNLKRIIHYGDVDNMMKAMRQMSAIFANAGGPLSIIFTNSLDRKCPPATSPEIERDGISGNVDGHIVAAGTEEYMLRHGIRIPSSASSRAGIADSTKIMYGAEDGEVYVQFHIRYSFSEEFTMILPSLKAEGIVPLIYTRDPNVTGELMKTLTGGDDCIRVLKKNNPRVDEDKIYRRISAGIVTSGDKINAINVILLTKKYVKLEKKLSIVELVAMGTGTALAIALAIAGALGITSLVFFGWQIAWCAALGIISRRSFSISEKQKETETNDE